MQIYLCKTVHWQAVLHTGLYYITELRLAANIKGDNFPIAGETIQFLANRILGTAVVKESYQNGYAGHFVLTDFNESSGDVQDVKVTDILQDASAEIMNNIDELQHTLFLIDEEQQNLAALFTALESRKTNINRRIAGKSVKLLKKPPRKRKATTEQNKKTQ